MKRNSLFSVLLLAGLCGAAYALKAPKGASLAEVTLPDGFKVSAELAVTREEQTRGLMLREKLPASQGMLFVFEEYSVRYFWMKDTLIDLDMVFLDPSLKVTRVFHRVPRSYRGAPEGEVARASAPASMVLELAAGTARAHGVRPGSRLKVVFLNKK